MRFLTPRYAAVRNDIVFRWEHTMRFFTSCCALRSEWQWGRWKAMRFFTSCCALRSEWQWGAVRSVRNDAEGDVRSESVDI